MVHYSVAEETNRIDGSDEYISFGITVSSGDNNMFTVHDVFLDENDAKRCAELFNEGQLDPIHLEQVIDEYLRYG